MGRAQRQWRVLLEGGVLTVLVAAALSGLTRPITEPAVAARQAAYASAAPTASYGSPAPGAILAPFAARGAVASRGDVAYTLVGGALTLADVPTPALAAYQRAAAVINLADPRCHLDWALVAAIAKVVSDHGRAGGSVLGEDGVYRPAVLGPRLTGRQGGQRVVDSDAGRFDGDPKLDRTVGPMQLLPETWALVSVDGDADGRRNPQDADDAALAVGVYLCAGPGDFRNAAHARDEVQGYHSGADFTKSVLGVRGPISTRRHCPRPSPYWPARSE
jgi:hypothetical protein